MGVATVTLNSGAEIPQLGLGVWQATNEEVEKIVAYAIGSAEYRHVDTAAAIRQRGGGRTRTPGVWHTS
ncbi:diketogulonate reductase-like aldo/keto reductase [Rhodococcus sp. 27YEA15]